MAERGCSHPELPKLGTVLYCSTNGILEVLMLFTSSHGELFRRGSGTRLGCGAAETGMNRILRVLHPKVSQSIIPGNFTDITVIQVSKREDSS